MRRHVLVGRYGSGDRVRIAAAPDEISTRFDLVAGARRLDYGIGRALDELLPLGLVPSEIGIDLAIVAAMVHAADTRIPRVTESQDTWTREIRLVVPVSDVTRWTDAAPLLTRMLDFLTGDRWMIGFRARPRGFDRLVARPARHLRMPYGNPSLFSGGLDSLIGAIDEIEAGGTPLLISHAGEGAVSNAQNGLFDALRNHYRGRQLDRLRVWMEFPRSLIDRGGKEETTRGRSFLFIALGVFAGTAFDGAFTLRVPENGLIALNVPLDPLRLGALTTRTTHPFYLKCWNDLLDRLGIVGRVENPYWDKTKGEMVLRCANLALLRPILAQSLSCSSPTKGRWRGRGVEHCGYCVPCLIRRAAIMAALGSGNDPTPYTLKNLRARVLDTGKSEGNQVRSFQLSTQRLSSRPALAKLLIHKPGPLLGDSTHLDALADVYRRGMAEVGALLAGVRAAPQ